MGAFVVKASMRDVSDAVADWFRSQPFGLVPASTVAGTSSGESDSGRVETKARTPSRLCPYTQECTLVDVGGETFVDVKLIPRMWVNLLFLSLTTVIILFPLHAAVYFEQLPPEQVLIEFLGTLVVGLPWLFVSSRLGRKFLAPQTSFWGFLRGKKFRMDIVTGIDARPCSDWAEFLTLSILIAATLFFVLKLFEPLLFVLCLFLAIVTMVPFCLRVVLSKDYAEQWKIWLVRVVTRWTTTCFFVVLVVWFLLVLNVAIVGSSLGLFSDLSPTEALRKGSTLLFSPEVFYRSDLALQEQNTLILAKALSTKSPEDPESLIKVLSALGLLGTILIVFVSYASSLRKLLNMVKGWGELVGKTGEACKIAVPPARRPVRTRPATKILVIIHYALAGVLNLTAGVLALEAVSFALAKRPLVIAESSVLFAWVFSCAKEILPRGLGEALASFILIFLAFPFLLFLYKSSIRLIGYVLRSLALQGSARTAKGLTLKVQRRLKTLEVFCRAVCEKYKLPGPRIVVRKNLSEPLFIRGELVGKRYTLFIHHWTIENLTQTELEAAVSHELGHAVQGMRKLEWVRFLCTITMFSNHYLTLCLDNSVSEVEADEFALKVIKTPEPLIGAIVRLSVAGLSNQFNPSKHPLLVSLAYRLGSQWLRKVLMQVQLSFDFFFGDGLMGYAHPVLSQRIAWLRSLDPEAEGRVEVGCG